MKHWLDETSKRLEWLNGQTQNDLWVQGLIDQLLELTDCTWTRIQTDFQELYQQQHQYMKTATNYLIEKSCLRHLICGTLFPINGYWGFLGIKTVDYQLSYRHSITYEAKSTWYYESTLSNNGCRIVSLIHSLFDMLHSIISACDLTSNVCLSDMVRLMDEKHSTSSP